MLNLLLGISVLQCPHMYIQIKHRVTDVSSNSSIKLGAC